MKRDIFTASLDLGNKLAIDNFAGGGGAIKCEVVKQEASGRN